MSHFDFRCSRLETEEKHQHKSSYSRSDLCEILHPYFPSENTELFSRCFRSVCAWSLCFSVLLKLGESMETPVYFALQVRLASKWDLKQRGEGTAPWSSARCSFTLWEHYGIKIWIYTLWRWHKQFDEGDKHLTCLRDGWEMLEPAEPFATLKLINAA